MTLPDPPVARAVFDLYLGTREETRAPSDAEVRAVERAGGRIVHRFHVDVIRAELDTAAARTLVDGPDAIAERAEQVLEPQRLTVAVQIAYDRPLTPLDSQQIVRLGGTAGRLLQRPLLRATLEDSVIPTVMRTPGVRYVRAQPVRCGRPG